MKRRLFLQTAAASALAVSTTGFIRFDGERYVGDCETTSDILGPFYRPDSPVRKSLVISGKKGERIELAGRIKHQDCRTPYKNAKIELWHCDGQGVYDNDSPDFNYRGTTFSDDNGNYSFQTILPVPYDVGNGNVRPAHFHLMVTAEGYQPLVTQLYFTGDTHIANDESAAAPTAKRRILDVQRHKDGTRKVRYDVAMSPTLGLEPAALHKLAGVYTDATDKNHKREFFEKDGLLWMKNELFGINFEYVGDNTFRLPGTDSRMNLAFRFESMPSGLVRLVVSSLNEKGERETKIALKEK